MVLGLAAGDGIGHGGWGGIMFKLTCPICSTQFEAGTFGTFTTSGGTAEGRPLDREQNIAAYMVCNCPHCHYAGQVTAFRIKYKDQDKPNVYYEYEDGYGKIDIPNAEQIKAIRTMLAKRRHLTSGQELYNVERHELAYQCLKLRRAKPQAMLDISLLCAWMCDDAAEDALALKYRKRAIEACRESLKTQTFSAPQLIWRKQLQWMLLSNIGKKNEALDGLTDLLPEAKRHIKTFRRTLPPKPRGYEPYLREMPYELEDDYTPANTGLFDPGSGGGLWGPEPPMDLKTRARLRIVWRPWLEFNALVRTAREIEEDMISVRYRTLDTAAAIDDARRGKFIHRYLFAEAYQYSVDPKIIAAIKGFIEKPLGERPKSVKPDKFELREDWRRGNITAMLEEGKEPFSELRKYVRDKKPPREIFYPGEYTPDPKELKNVPTSDLVARITEIRKNADPRQSLYHEKISRNVLAALVSRSDKKAVAALYADFEQHIEWYTEYLWWIIPDWFPKYYEKRRESRSWADARTTIYYWGNGRSGIDYWPVYKKLARDPKLTLAMSRRLIEKIKSGKIKGEAIAPCIMPLGFLKTDQSRQLLIETSRSNNRHTAFATALCLLIRNDPAGKNAMINAILTHHLMDLPMGIAGENFIGMLKREDAAILPKLTKLYLEHPGYIKKKPRDYDSKKGRGWPIRLIAVLAKVDDRQIPVYQKVIAELGRRQQRPADGDWSKATGGYNTKVLVDASRAYYLPSIGKRLAAAIGDTRYDPYVNEIAELIGVLVKLSPADCTQALTKLLKRPTPLDVKIAIIEASNTLDIPGMPEKLTEWSSSRNTKLAKAAIARTKKTQK
jgi:hypothetical protein